MAGLPIQVIIKKAFGATVLAKRAVDAAVREFGKEALIMERDMKKRAPANFGDLRADIGVAGPIRKGYEVNYEVGVRENNYARFVEFGTGPAGSEGELSVAARAAMQELGYRHGPGNFLPPVSEIEKWLKRKGLPKEMAWPIARRIGRRGVRAQPFVFPAFEARARKSIDNVQRAVAKALGAG